jgi:hypothetical protein
MLKEITINTATYCEPLKRLKKKSRIKGEEF